MPDAADPVGTGGTGVARGIITDVEKDDATIKVNGAEFDVSRARIVKNGMPSDAAALKPGTVVFVEADYKPTGKYDEATRISVHVHLKGAMDKLLAFNRLRLLGQDVLVDNNTVLANFNVLKQLHPGDFLEVSGFHRASGGLLATRVERLTAPVDTLWVKGDITAVDVEAEVLRIGSLTVDAGSARLEGVDNLGLAAGQYAMIEGVRRPDGVLVADRIVIGALAPVITPGIKVVWEGLVNQIDSPSRIVVGGHPVRIMPDARFPEGRSAADIALNERLWVSGANDAEGILQATRIRFPGSGRECIRATLASEGVDPAARRIRLLNVTALVDDRTIVEDKSAMGVDHLSLADMVEGESIMVCGDENLSGEFVATHIERHDPSNLVVTKGFATGENPQLSQLEIMGVRVKLSSQTAAHGVGGEIVPAPVFIDQATSDEVTVSAKGALVGESPYTISAIEAWIRK